MSVSEKIIAIDTLGKFKAEESESQVVRGPRGRQMFPPLDIVTPGYDACATCPTIREKIVGGDGDPNGLGSGLPLYSGLFNELPIGPVSKYTGFPHSISRIEAVAIEIGGRKLRAEVSNQIGASQAALWQRFYDDKGQLPLAPSTWIPDHIHGPISVYCRPERNSCATIWVGTEDDTTVVFNQFSNSDQGSLEKFYGISLEQLFVPVAHKVRCPALVSGEATVIDMADRFNDGIGLTLKISD